MPPLFLKEAPSKYESSVSNKMSVTAPAFVENISPWIFLLYPSSSIDTLPFSLYTAYPSEYMLVPPLSFIFPSSFHTAPIILLFPNPEAVIILPFSIVSFEDEPPLYTATTWFASFPTALISAFSPIFNVEFFVLLIPKTLFSWPIESRLDIIFTLSPILILPLFSLYNPITKTVFSPKAVIVPPSSIINSEDAPLLYTAEICLAPFPITFISEFFPIFNVEFPVLYTE